MTVGTSPRSSSGCGAGSSAGERHLCGRLPLPRVPLLLPEGTEVTNVVPAAYPHTVMVQNKPALCLGKHSCCCWPC